jgi:hypothetical protein
MLRGLTRQRPKRRECARPPRPTQRGRQRLTRRSFCARVPERKGKFKVDSDRLGIGLPVGSESESARSSMAQSLSLQTAAGCLLKEVSTDRRGHGRGAAVSCLRGHSLRVRLARARCQPEGHLPLAAKWAPSNLRLPPAPLARRRGRRQCCRVSMAVPHELVPPYRRRRGASSAGRRQFCQWSCGNAGIGYSCGYAVGENAGGAIG